MKTKLILMAILLGSGLSLPAYAESSEEEGLDYDAIVRKLSRGQTSEENLYASDDPFEQVKIHLGVGLTNSVYTVQHTNGDRTYGAQRGIQVSLGIDLFSKNWLAEGTFRNFGESQFEYAKISVKEFDLKLLYQSRFTPSWQFRAGGGLAARYMNIDYNKNNIKESKQAQTPASVIQAGLLTYLTPGFSVGADASARTALINDTPDRNSYDLTIRLDGHF